MLRYNYLLLDAARAEMNLYKAIELNTAHQSLYKGSAEEELSGVAPYLFTMKEGTPFSDWYFKEGWGKSWGIPLFANVAFEDVYKHFRRFLMVKTEDGKQLYFRFYDPRVLRIFLPTCDEYQLRELFGPVRHFITESENEQEALQFWLENTRLRMDKKPVIHPAVDTGTDTPNNEDNTVRQSNLKEAPNADDTSASTNKPKKKWDFYFDE